MTVPTIAPDILAILRTAQIEDNLVRLTCGQLDPKTYKAVNDVLVRLGGKWKGGRTAAHVFPFDPRYDLQGVILTGDMPPKNPLAFFPTPPELADELVLLAGSSGAHCFLEPSAGAGALADAVRKFYDGMHVVCVECSSYHAAMLRGKGYTVHEADFLSIDLSPFVFDRVVMNPPFTSSNDKLAYITHITRAWELLNPRSGFSGGRLVAIAPSGFTFRTDKRSAAFRALVEQHGGWKANPPDAFKASGTNAQTVMLWLDK
jgi:hypothetical protein